jgi:hypothetical protein
MEWIVVLLFALIPVAALVVWIVALPSGPPRTAEGRMLR